MANTHEAPQLTNISPDMLDGARETLLPLVHQPEGLEIIPGLRGLLGYEVYFHPEFRHAHDRTGSFKDNGATYKLEEGQKSGDIDERGIIAISSGNHAFAVATAARKRDIDALIVMAASSSAHKMEEARKQGATVFTDGVDIKNRVGIFNQMAKETGRYKVPAFDDVTIATGHGGGAGLTMVEHLNSLKDPVQSILIPVGGGGLIAGVGAAIKHRLRRPAYVMGVEPEDAADAGQSFSNGHIVSLNPPSSSIADGIQTTRLGDNVFPLIRKYVNGFAPGVPERYTMLAHRIMENAFARNGEHVEPTSAVALGALLQDYDTETGRFNGDVAIFVSGGNWDPDEAGDAYTARLASLRDDFVESQRLKLDGPVNSLLFTH